MQEMSGHMLGVLKKVAAGEGMAKYDYMRQFFYGAWRYFCLWLYPR
jgi:hypothetical protein